MTRAIGLVLYPRFTALDIVGPYEVLCRVPGARTVWIAETLEPVRADRGLTIVPDETFASAGDLDVVVVPGGPGQFDQMENAALLGFLRSAAARVEVVASVCTGSLLLAAAGLLEGKRATTHWLARDALAQLGVQVVDERVVWDGAVLTAAGVSAGIDGALSLAAHLSGDDVARTIQLGIEYDPQPPFDAGSPERAGAPTVEYLLANARAYLV